jgi:hypothetical protein
LLIFRIMAVTQGRRGSLGVTNPMEESPFSLVWPVDQGGYEIRRDEEKAGLLGKRESEFVVRRGGPTRYYRPLENDGLWLRFAQTCKNADSVLSFTNEFGLLRRSPDGRNRLDDILETAAFIQRIADHLQAGERLAALKLFNRDLPNLKAGILWFAAEPERYYYRLVPVSLRDGLLYQGGEAITGNRRFRPCRNDGCPNWFRLGPHGAHEGTRRQTYTARREFCSDRCRVASARRQKREASGHA